jgi:hypothetical protein
MAESGAARLRPALRRRLAVFRFPDFPLSGVPLLADVSLQTAPIRLGRNYPEAGRGAPAIFTGCGRAANFAVRVFPPEKTFFLQLDFGMPGLSGGYYPNAFG